MAFKSFLKNLYTEYFCAVAREKKGDPESPSRRGIKKVLAREIRKANLEREAGIVMLN